jgi:hypothetical protein
MANFYGKSKSVVEENSSWFNLGYKYQITL